MGWGWREGAQASGGRCERGEAYLRRRLVAEVSPPPCRSPAPHGIIMRGLAQIAIDRISATAGGVSAIRARASAERSSAAFGGAVAAIQVVSAIMVEGTGRGRRR